MKGQTNKNFIWLAGDAYNPDTKDWDEYRKQWFECPEKLTLPRFPLFLDIEATSACNLKCPSCVQTHADFRKGYMHMGLYNMLIDEASDNGCYGCKYHTLGRGEPLLHSKIPQMVAYAKKKGMIDVRLNTNGTLLNGERSKALLDAGLDQLIVSIDGYEKEYYESKRVGAKWETVLKNVSNFFLLRHEGNYNTHVRVQTIAFDDLDLDRYAMFWRIVSDEVAAIKFKLMTEREMGVKALDWVCPQLWQRASVTWEGKIFPCNHDDRQLFGYYTGSVRRVWNTAGSITQAREFHKQGWSHRVPACDGCYFRAAEIRKD